LTLPQNKRTPKKFRDGVEILSLRELDLLRRQEALGEVSDLEEVDPSVETELFMAICEDVATERNQPNPQDEEYQQRFKAELEAASRQGVMRAQAEERARERNGQMAPVDNTANLRRMADIATQRALASARTPELKAALAEKKMVTSVWFVGMSIDQLRKWVDACYHNHCVTNTKASRIRLMAAHGMSTTLMAKVLQTSYQQVYQTARYQPADSVDLPESQICPVCRRRKHKR
jgi:hypothetical protein